jgi:hypothetical protein
MTRRGYRMSRGECRQKGATPFWCSNRSLLHENACSTPAFRKSDRRLHALTCVKATSADLLRKVKRAGPRSSIAIRQIQGSASACKPRYTGSSPAAATGTTLAALVPGFRSRVCTLLPNRGVADARFIVEETTEKGPTSVGFNADRTVEEAEE